MTTLSNPHDAFCKYVLGRPEQAGAFLDHFLPSELVAPLDLASLTALPGTFVDPDLANHHCDLLFSAACKDGAQVLVYVLFEHKSEADRKTPLQLYRYMERIWDVYLKDKGRLPLPPILPIVIHQGVAPWPYPTDFESIVDKLPGYGLFVPKFSFYLVDLCLVNDSAFPADPILGAAFLIMKHVQRPGLAEAIEGHCLVFSGIFLHSNGLEFFKAMLTYIFNTAHAPARKEILTALEHAVPPEGGPYMQTIAESWKEEGIVIGRSKGIDIGRAKGFSEIIVDDLEIRFSSLPQPLVARIREIKDIVALKALRRKLLNVDSIEECERIVAQESTH